MSISLLIASMGGAGALGNSGTTQVQRRCTSAGPPGYQPLPLFTANAGYDPAASSGEEQFQFRANWVSSGGNTTTTIKLTARPLRGSADYTFTWSLSAAGSWGSQPSSKADFYVAHVGSTDASATVTLTVTDNRSGESYTEQISVTARHTGSVEP